MKKLIVLMFVCVIAGADYIQPKRVQWINSTAPDVAMHRVFVVPEAQVLDLNSPYVDVLMPESFYDFPGVFTITDGNYRVGVAAADHSGNISNIAEVVFPFDFTVPPAPTSVAIVNP